MEVERDKLQELVAVLRNQVQEGEQHKDHIGGAGTHRADDWTAVRFPPAHICQVVLEPQHLDVQDKRRRR